MLSRYSGGVKRLMSGPRLRPDLRGYIIDGEAVDGFADRTDLSLSDRIVIARLCNRYSPKHLSAVQRKLSRTSEAQRQPVASDLLRGFAINDATIDAVAEEGFLEELTEDELRLVGDPSLHPDLPNATYPLTIGQLATLTGATQRQLRHWDDAALVPAERVNGQRRFYSAGVVRAFVLARADTYQVTALASIARGEPEGLRLLRLVAASAAALAKEGLSGQASVSFVEAAHRLSGLPASLVAVHYDYARTRAPRVLAAAATTKRISRTSTNSRTSAASSTSSKLTLSKVRSA